MCALLLFLTCLIPPGRDRSLSAATGTAARTSWGILVVILAGLAVLLPVKPAQGQRTPAPAEENRALEVE